MGAQGAHLLPRPPLCFIPGNTRAGHHDWTAKENVHHLTLPNGLFMETKHVARACRALLYRIYIIFGEFTCEVAE